MAKTPSKKPDEQAKKDKDEQLRDIRTFIEMSRDFVYSGLNEDTYIDSVSAFTEKLKKGKKPKKVKDRDGIVLEINEPISDFHISYLQGVINQVFNDTGLKIKLKL